MALDSKLLALVQSIGADIKALIAGKASLSGGNAFTGNQSVAGYLTVSDEVYGGAWDASLQVPTKNAVYDKITAVESAIAGKVSATEKGQANGVATLDGNGFVPASQLPSYVDDVLEYANLAAFPATGTSGKIFVAIDTAKPYRWTGSVYVEISASPGSTDAVTEGSTNLYFTTARVLATAATGLADVSGTPAAADSILTILGKIKKGFFTDHSGAGGAVHAAAVANGANGFMTGADKNKLDGIATGATANTNIASLTAAATARFFGRVTAGSGPGEELTGTQATSLLNTFTNTLKGLVNPPTTATNKYLRDDNTWQQDVRTITFVIDGGGSAITAGLKGFLEIPFACTIDRWTIVADQAGSAVVDVWKSTYAAAPPAIGGTITASAKPTLSAAQKAQSATLTGWTTAVAAGDVLAFNVDSAATVTRLTISLRVNVA